MGDMEVFTSSAREFSALRARASDLVDPSVELPAWVFRAEDGVVDFCEYEFCAMDQFEAVVGSLAVLHGDETVSMVVTNTFTSKNLDFYVSRAGHYPAFTLPVSEITGAFWEPASDLAQGADSFVILGTSGRWAIRGDWDWEIAVLWSRSGPSVWREHTVPFMSVGDALEMTRFAFSYHHEPLASGQAELFIANYSPLEPGRVTRVSVTWTFDPIRTDDVLFALDNFPASSGDECVFSDHIEFYFDLRVDTLQHGAATGLASVVNGARLSFLPGRAVSASASDDEYHTEWRVADGRLIDDAG